MLVRTRIECLDETYNFVTRLNVVNQIVQQNYVFAARQSTRRNRAGTLLQRDLLIVAVHGLRDIS